MSLRLRVLPSILNGVSRQPPILRASDQNESELNTWSSMSTGLAKRPPSEFVAKLTDTMGDGAFVHYINRDTTERYCVVIDSEVIRVFDIETGEEKPVTAPDGFGYLQGGEYRAVTVADYTFIVNVNATCATATDVDAPEVDSPNSRWINRGSQGGEVTTNLFAGGFGLYRSNPPAGTYAGSVSSIEKLPETAPNGTMYKVTGSIETGFVSYYVRRVGAVWEETVANGLRNHLDQTTMPYALVSEGDGTFNFAPFSWAPRRVGDADSNPDPTFVGRNIRDVFFYQNRLGFLVDENVVFSTSGDFGNFYRNTVLDYISSDMVDHAVTTTSISILEYALPFNDGIMAFADQTQFSIENGEEGLTPESLSISPVTRYEMNTKARPVSIGTEVYFCGNQNGSTVVWEYARLEQGDSLSAAEITAHVPDYIPANVKQLIAAPNSKALFAVTEDGRMFAYQFYWNGNEKIQSAWREWSFNGTVKAGQFMDESLLLVVRRDDGVYLNKVNLAEGAKPAAQAYQVYLDDRVDLTGTYNSVQDETTFVLPYGADWASLQLVRDDADPTRPGSLVDPSTYQVVNATTVRVPGQVLSATAGHAYRMALTFSQQYPLDYQGRPVVSGRLQLRTFRINYTGTAFFRTEVQPYGDAMDPDVEDIVPALLADFTGKVVGSDELKLNRPSYHTGSYSFQIYGDAAQATITISNDTHVGSTFTSAEWEGFSFNRASR